MKEIGWGEIEPLPFAVDGDFYSVVLWVETVEEHF
ncbi:hypothetical protein A2U01_0074456, partial [Trifolium medium]|nr:hypothetical protein [Trifolium medium]